jgi:hypothetical protein
LFGDQTGQEYPIGKCESILCVTSSVLGDAYMANTVRSWVPRTGLKGARQSVRGFSYCEKYSLFEKLYQDRGSNEAEDGITRLRSPFETF